MKRLFSVLIFSLVAVTCFSQVENPVSWSFSAKKITDKTYEIRITAKIEDGWHIYSQTTPDGGPVPTNIDFNKNPLISLENQVKEVGKLENHFEELFGVEVKQFSKKVDFVQIIKLKAAAKTNISGNVKFMACNDEVCMPPKSLPFTISLK